MKGQKKTRFQTYMYDESESDIIDFINSFREDDIRMLFISTMRLYMTFSGHYFRSNLKDAGIKSDIPMAGNGGNKPGSDQDNEEEIEIMERLSRFWTLDKGILLPPAKISGHSQFFRFF